MQKVEDADQTVQANLCLCHLHIPKIVFFFHNIAHIQTNRILLKVKREHKSVIYLEDNFLWTYHLYSSFIFKYLFGRKTAQLRFD